MITKATAILEALTLADLEAAPPARRQRFAQLARHLANLADPPKTPPAPKVGILADLKRGERGE